jgi:hypothetical protein
LSDLERLLNEYEFISEKAPQILDEYFSGTRKNVYSFREQLIENLNLFSREYLSKVDEYETEC